MKKILIKNGNVVFAEDVRKTSLLIAGGRIQKIGEEKNYDQVIDADGLYVIPGLIDLHYHGLFMFPSPEKMSDFLERVQRKLILRGVSGFLATFPATPVPRLIECLISLKEACQRMVQPGARLLGVHLEGPFLSKDAKGAQPEDAIVEYDPDSAEMARLFDAGRGLVRMMSFSPEQRSARELLDVLKKENIVPALGHSVASFEVAEEFCESGARYLTHLFNGMRGIHHRDPGLALAGLVDDRFYREIIVDGYHLHPAVVKLVWRSSPEGKVVLITDFVGDEDPLDIEPPRMAGGGLAGSRLRLIRAVRNLIRFSGAGISEAVRSASLNPSRVLGLTELGRIQEGAESCLALADDRLRLKKVIFGEEIIDAQDDQLN